MRAAQRWRYYCDHCTKVSGLRSAMEKHEKGCTLNPARSCGICTVINGGSPVELPELLALLPDPKKFTRTETWDAGEEFGGSGTYEVVDDDGLRDAVHAALPRLRELTDDCPACILAALRQKKIPVPLVTDFDWTKEFAAAQARMNEHRAEQEGRYY